MGKQSPNKRKSEVNSNETPKKAKVVEDTPKTPVNSPVKQTPQKNNKTPKSQKKQKPQTPAKEPLTNGVASKKVQIKENNQNTPASTPAKGKGEKKYPVTPAMKGNVAKSPETQEKGKKTPPGTPNKQNEGKLEKFAGVKSLDGSTATSPAETKKKQKNKIVLATDVAAGLSKRQKKRMATKLRKASMIESKKTNVEKKGTDSAAKKSIKEIAANVAEGENPMTKTQMRKLKKMQKLATAATAETTNNPENNSVQSPKAKKNKKKGKNKENQALDQANGAQVAEVKNNQNAKNQKQKGNQKKENQQQQQQQQQQKKKKQKVESKVGSEGNNEEESDYEVETSIKPEKVSKKMNESEDIDNEGAKVLGDNDEEMEDESDDDDIEETDNSLNENNENEQKDQKKPKKQKKVDPKDLNNAGILTKGQSRYVLFVGNLPFDATKEQVTEHFNKTCEVKHVRIPTDQQSKKPRGFAYVEVPNEDSYHKALALHHSFVSGRRINVLYTQGGTKNSENKKQNIKSKNFKLQAMRRDGKLPGGVKDSQKRSVRRAIKRTFDTNTE